MNVIPYTPGPWGAAKAPALDSSQPWQVIAVNVPHPNPRKSHYPLTVAVLDRTVSGPTEHANAKLLAAAPDLFEKVTSLLTQTCGRPGAEYMRDNDHTRALIAELRDVVDQAKFIPERDL